MATKEINEYVASNGLTVQWRRKKAKRDSGRFAGKLKFHAEFDDDDTAIIQNAESVKDIDLFDVKHLSEFVKKCMTAQHPDMVFPEKATATADKSVAVVEKVAIQLEKANKTFKSEHIQQFINVANVSDADKKTLSEALKTGKFNKWIKSDDEPVLDLKL